MPVRLRPTSDVAADAILVGDPGRALLLAQELLEKPRMSNHARGLWGYSGAAADGRALTVQATGIGGPSAAAVLADLAKLGVRRAVRVGTCTALADDLEPGDLLVAREALAGGGSATAFGVEVGDAVAPDPALLGALERVLAGEARCAPVVSLDALPHPEPEAGGPTARPAGARAGEPAQAADMQTVAVFARGRQLGVATAAVLIVAESPGGGGAEPRRLGDEEAEEAARRGGRAAREALSNPQVEG